MHRDIKRRLRWIDQHLFEPDRTARFAFRHFLLDRNFLLLVARPPSTLIRGLAQSNAIDPGPQSRLAMEVAHSPEDLHKDLLREVGRLASVLYRSRQKRVDGLMVARNQPRKCLLRAGTQFSNESGFVG